MLALVPEDHLMEVTANGPWEIIVTQEFPQTAPQLPLARSGQGSTVLTWVMLEKGRHTMEASHTGRSNFIVEILSADGGSWDLLINDIGNYQGEKLLRVESGILDLDPGVYCIAIEADGEWSIEIR